MYWWTASNQPSQILTDESADKKKMFSFQLKKCDNIPWMGSFVSTSFEENVGAFSILGRDSLGKDILGERDWKVATKRVCREKKKTKKQQEQRGLADHSSQQLHSKTIRGRQGTDFLTRGGPNRTTQQMETSWYFYFFWPLFLGKPFSPNCNFQFENLWKCHSTSFDINDIIRRYPAISTTQ